MTAKTYQDEIKMKTTPLMIDHFTANAKVYDERNMPLAPIADSMHFLIRLILKDAPVCAHVLCAGVGTGNEILSRYRNWLWG